MEISYGDVIWRYHMIMWYTTQEVWFLMSFETYVSWFSRPSGGNFWKNNDLQNQEENFWISRMALNHDLIVQPYSGHSQLQESCLNIFHLPIFDRFMAYRRSKKNFGPNVIYCFLGYVDIVWRYHVELSHGDIIWSYRMEISYGDIIWRYHMMIWYGDVWFSMSFET